MTPQAEVFELASQEYHVKSDKTHNHCPVLVTAFQLTEVTDHLIHAVHAAPFPLGLENHQAHVSNVVELVTGPEHALILILVP